MDFNTAQQIVTSLPFLGNVERIEFLDKGFSHDKKYVLWQHAEPRYVLRLSNAAKMERWEAQADILAKLRDIDVLCHQPFDTGLSADGETCFSVVSYLTGESADESLDGLTDEQQYEIGFSAGQQLRKIHRIPHPNPDFDWPAHRRAKYRTRLEQARRLGLTFGQQERVERYVEDSMGLLDEVPVRFQHDDFHPGNLIIRDGQFAGIIDFENRDWGDPIEDFYKIPWFTAPLSTPFARGQVHGYCSENVPRDFWRRYNLFVALQLHATLVYAYQGQFDEGMDRWYRQTIDILATHDFENSGPPTWYTG